MDKDIKRLLRLSSIPGFVLLKKEQKKLDEWKAAQVKVKPKAPRKKSTPKGYARMEMGTNEDGTLIKTKDLGAVPEEAKVLEEKAKETKKTRRKTVKNVVTEKETGETE